MGHKGVSKRKPPQIKVKPLATANRGSGAVSALAQPGGASGQLPGKTGAVPFGQSGQDQASRSKKKHKKH